MLVTVIIRVVAMVWNGTQPEVRGDGLSPRRSLSQLILFGLRMQVDQAAATQDVVVNQ